MVTAQLFTRTSSAPSSTWSVVAAHWSAVACAVLAIGVSSTFGEGRRLSTSRLGAQLSSRPAFPSSRREPLSSPRDSKASNMRPLLATTIPSLAGRSQGESLLGLGRRESDRQDSDRFYEQSRSAPGVPRFFIPRRSVRPSLSIWCHVSHTQIVSVDPCKPLTANVWVNWDIRGNFNVLSKGSRTFAHCGAQQWS